MLYIYLGVTVFLLAAVLTVLNICEPFCVTYQKKNYFTVLSYENGVDFNVIFHKNSAKFIHSYYLHTGLVCTNT